MRRLRPGRERTRREEVGRRRRRFAGVGVLVQTEEQPQQGSARQVVEVNERWRGVKARPRQARLVATRSREGERLALLATGFTTTGHGDKLLEHPLAHDEVAAEDWMQEDGCEEEGQPLSPPLEERRAVLGCGAWTSGGACSSLSSWMTHREKISAGGEGRCCGSEGVRREDRIAGARRRSSGGVCVL